MKEAIKEPKKFEGVTINENVQPKKVSSSAVKKALGHVAEEPRPQFADKEVRAIMEKLGEQEALVKTVMMEVAQCMKAILEKLSEQQGPQSVTQATHSNEPALDLEFLSPIMDRLKALTGIAWRGKQVTVQSIISSLERVKDGDGVTNVWEDIQIPLISMLCKELGIAVDGKTIYL